MQDCFTLKLCYTYDTVLRVIVTPQYSTKLVRDMHFRTNHVRRSKYVAPIRRRYSQKPTVRSRSLMDFTRYGSRFHTVS